MSRTRWRAIFAMSTYASVVTSPATTTSPVVTRVSTATRLLGSWVSNSSSTESAIESATLSGWPSVTDSDVNRRGTALPIGPVSYTHLRAHETDSYLVCRLLLEKK